MWRIVNHMKSQKRQNNTVRSILPLTNKWPAKLMDLVKRNNGSPHEVHQRIQRVQHNGIGLVIIRAPDEKDLSYLKRHYNFHPLHLDDVMSSIQNPKIDFEENYIFFVLHFPQMDTHNRRIELKEIDFFLTEKDVIVIINAHCENIEQIISKISKNKKLRQEFFEKGTGLLLYHILDKLVDSFFPLLNNLENNIDQIDKDVFTNLSPLRNIVEEVSYLKRNLIFLRSIIKPELVAFQNIGKQNHYLIDKEAIKYFANLTEHLSKLWEKLENAKELADNLSLTVESYLSSRTNETIKILTIFSVILLPLNLLTGVYGMNLNFLPLAEHPWAIFFIAFIMLGLVFGMITYFRLRRWI